MILTNTFPGGIHVGENKYTSSSPIQYLPESKIVVLPVIQHTGVPATPIVKVNDYVRVGQKIASAEGFISAPIHASISGKVVNIEERMHPTLCKRVISIIIESDGENKLYENVGVERNTELLTKEELLNIIRDSGIVGLGGAGFPTAVKLSPPKNKKIDTFILNACECEPYITSDERLLLEHGKEVIEGMKIIMFILGVKTGYIGIEDNKPEAIKILHNIVEKERKYDIKVKVLKTKYPQGGEKQLIYSVLRRKVPLGKLPLDVGVVVNNVATAYAIYRAVKFNTPLIERVITVTGENISARGNFRVKIGTLVDDILNFCKIDLESSSIDGKGTKIIFGGPMMGIAQYTTNVPVIKTTNCILLLKDSITLTEDKGCIRCSKCVLHCPMRLMPNFIAFYAERRLFDEAKRYGALDCIECGVCAYVCPGKRPLVQLVKFAKTNLLAKK
jgi:electron transport complex protein RnfC